MTNKYNIDVNLITESLDDLYKEISKLNKLGRTNYLILEALDKLENNDIHNLKEFDDELDNIENEFNVHKDLSSLNKIVLLANNLNNFVFDKYLNILNKLKDGRK